MTEDITDSSFDCAGSLAYLFSQRPLSRNEQHEPHAVLFHARHHHPQHLFAEVPSFQEHGAAPSAMYGWPTSSGDQGQHIV